MNVQMPTNFPITAVFTDASFHNNFKYGACAYVVATVKSETQFLKGEGHIINRASDFGRFVNVQECELYGVYLYLKELQSYAIQFGISPKNINNIAIFCDNKTIIDALRNNSIAGKFNISHPFAKEMQSIVNEFAGVQYYWVRGHANFRWNEIAHAHAYAELKKRLKNKD